MSAMSGPGAFRPTAIRHTHMSSAPDSDRHLGRASPHLVPGLSGRSSPMPLSSLSHALIVEALAESKDEGATLNFSQKNLVDVGEAGAEELAQVGKSEESPDECSVLRIALVGNRLATLPMAFSFLSRLRYLTLRSNSFAVFPEVLTIMPSLEILDLSRNKIKRLPSNPGSLVNLRVLSLSRNKLHRLPTYFTNFLKLSVLKVDHNPIEWPPKAVMDSPEDLDDSEVMRKWLDSVRKWITENSPADASFGDSRKLSDESSISRSESSQTDLASIGDSLDSDSWPHFISKDNYDAGVTPHARSFSIDSEVSTYSTPSFIPPNEPFKPDGPPPLHLACLPPSIPSSLSASPETYLPTPEDSLTSADDDATRAMDDTQLARDRQHGRNASYACEGFTKSRGTGLMAKKSLPDLRTAKVHFATDDRRHARPQRAEVFFNTKPDEGHTPSPPYSQKGTSPMAMLSETPPLRLRADSRTRQEPGPSPKSTEWPAPSMDYARNSYFRRHSSMPTSAISNVVPQALLTLVDAVRGILFAVSQVYQSLQHYTVYAIDERLSSVLLKVLDPASRYMSQLINALDRFDTMSRRGFPSPAVCRNVVESCRDNVAVFGKAVGVLALQLKVLATRDDVRYTRQMLLSFYGAMAEISNAWQSMAPQLEAIEPLLRDSRPPPTSTKPGSSSRITIPPIAEQPEPAPASAPPATAPSLYPAPPPMLRAHSAQPAPVLAPSPPRISRSHSAQPPSLASTVREGRTRMNRRHAGSFSVKDVQIGKSLPSNFELTPPSGGVVSGTASPTPTPRLSPRPPLPPPSGPVPPLPSSVTVPHSHPPAPASSSSSFTSHIRHDSQSLSSTSASSSSQSIPFPSKLSHLDIPSNSNTLVDKEAIDAMDGAVRAAPAVWSMLEEILNDMPEATIELRDCLSSAQALTNNLRQNIKAFQEDTHNADRKALREDAHVFAKTVIQLSNVVKTYGSAHRLTAQLKKDIAKLTNATQAFVMLLHVSSFSPSSTPRPYSPMLSSVGAAAQASVLNQALDDTKQGASLSRSRSAQPPASSRLASHASKAAPRSALPHQTFKISPPPRLGTKMRLHEDAVEGIV